MHYPSVEAMHAGMPHALNLWAMYTSVPQEMRKSKYMRTTSSDRDVMQTIAELQLPVETLTGVGGISLLPAATVEQLLVDKRRLELVQPFRLALLKLASQVGTGYHSHDAVLCGPLLWLRCRLMANGTFFVAHYSGSAAG